MYKGRQARWGTGLLGSDVHQPLHWPLSRVEKGQAAAVLWRGQMGQRDPHLLVIAQADELGWLHIYLDPHVVRIHEGEHHVIVINDRADPLRHPRDQAVTRRMQAQGGQAHLYLRDLGSALAHLDLGQPHLVGEFLLRVEQRFTRRDQEPLVVPQFEILYSSF